MRRIIAALAAAVLLACGPAAAEDHSLIVLSSEAWARGTVGRPIHVDVKVKNAGSEPVDGILLVLVTTPQPPSDIRQKFDDLPDGLDPREMLLPVGKIDPGQVKTLSFRTPYQSTRDFDGAAGFFYATGLGPAVSDVKVTYTFKWN